MRFRSYSQNFEDVILWRCLKDIKTGFYVDVGAQHPVVDSVSLGFYEKGWRGIHVDPSPEYAELLRQYRPDEVVIQKAISTSNDPIAFYQIEGTGLSTSDHGIAASHESLGFQNQCITVATTTLAEIFDGVSSSEIHWLKIDVEGLEGDVLDSWGGHSSRPWIVCIESTLPLTKSDLSYQWAHKLLDRGYKFGYFDGLNQFYVSSEKPELLDLIKIPPNVFDNFELAKTHHLCAYLGHSIDVLSREQKTLVSENRNLRNTVEVLRVQSRDRIHKAAQQLARYNIRVFSLEKQLLEVQKKNEDLTGQRDHFISARDAEVDRYLAISSSSFWKATYPARWLIIQLRLLKQYGLLARFLMLVKKVRK